MWRLSRIAILTQYGYSRPMTPNAGRLHRGIGTGMAITPFWNSNYSSFFSISLHNAGTRDVVHALERSPHGQDDGGESDSLLIHTLLPDLFLLLQTA